MKKIPSLDELRDAPSAEPVAAAQAAVADESGDRSGVPPGDTLGDAPVQTLAERVLSAADLPADVLEHAVRLGADAPAETAAPTRGAQRKGGNSRQGVRRRYSRERAVQALYAWDISDSSASEVLRYFLEQQDMSRADVDWFREAFTGVAHDPAPVDALIEPVLDRGFDDLDPVERAILRLGVWELKNRLDTPVRVVINEAVEVAKRFGAEQGHRFVNGVLDTVARELRAAELG